MHVRPTLLSRLALSGALLATLACAGVAQAASPEEQAVLAPFQALLDGIGKRDHAMMRDALLPGGMITLKRGDKISQLHFDAFIDRIPTTGKEQLAERIHDPLIRIDDDIAIIWAPYEFLIDGKVDHCGTDIAHLVKKDGKWLVAGIADNQHATCAGK